MAQKRTGKGPAAKRAAKRPAAKKATRKAPSGAKAASRRPGAAGGTDGDAPVKAYIAALPPERREVVRRLDALIEETVPGVRRALRWGMPVYGVEGRGWFASVAGFKDHVNLVFFRGAGLVPPPPLGEGREMRRASIRDAGDYDEPRFRGWIRQAASMQGWGKVGA